MDAMLKNKSLNKSDLNLSNNSDEYYDFDV
jgi:hypothetical protein